MRDFSSRSRASSLLKACSGTKRIMKGTRIPEKMATNPNGHRQDLIRQNCEIEIGEHSISDYAGDNWC